MAIRGSDQITIIDVTDAYSVLLTSEAYTFVGTGATTAGVGYVPAGRSCTTEVVAFCGAKACKVSVGTVTCPANITYTLTTDNNIETVGIKFTTTGTLQEDCEATIEVTVDDVTITKKFSFAVATAGQLGTNGTNGIDAITVNITADGPLVFKNSSGSVNLTANVYNGVTLCTVGEDGTVDGLGVLKWYKGNPDGAEGSYTEINASTAAGMNLDYHGSYITVEASDVEDLMLITARLEETA